MVCFANLILSIMTYIFTQKWQYSCQDPVPAIPSFLNIERLENGYNYFTGDSFQAVDPGFKHQIFNFTYTKGLSRGNKRVPDGLQVTVVTGQQETQKSKIVSSKEQYEQNSGISLKVPIPTQALGLPPLSLGIQYNKVAKQVFQNAKKMYERRVTEYHYEVNLVSEQDISLNQKFKEDVQSLPLTIDKKQDSQKYLRFISKYGTHYIVQCVMGASFSSRMFYSQTIQTQSLQKGISMSAQFKSVQIGAEQSFAYKFKNKNQDFQLQQKSKGKNGSKNYNQWKRETEQISPQPIQYTLNPIYSLLTPSHFPQIEKNEIQQVSLLLKEYTFSTRYCFDLKSQGNIDYCDIYQLIPSIKEIIQVMQKGLNVFQTQFIEGSLPKYSYSQEKLLEDFTYSEKKTITLGERKYKFPDQLDYEFVNNQGDTFTESKIYSNGLQQLSQQLTGKELFIQNIDQIDSRSLSSLAYNNWKQDQVILMNTYILPVLKIKHKQGLIKNTTEFMHDISQINRHCFNNSNKYDILPFIQKYGTHQIKQLTLGGYSGTVMQLNFQQLSAIEIYMNIDYSNFNFDAFAQYKMDNVLNFKVYKDFYNIYFLQSQDQSDKWKEVSKFMPKINAFKLDQFFSSFCTRSEFNRKFGYVEYFGETFIDLPRPICKLCTSCGGSFPHKMGMFQAQDTQDEHFVYGYGRSCQQDYGLHQSQYIDFCCQTQKKQSTPMICQSCSSSSQKQVASFKHDIQISLFSYVQDFDFWTFGYSCNSSSFSKSDVDYPKLCAPKQESKVPCIICSRKCGGQYPFKMGAVLNQDYDFISKTKGYMCDQRGIDGSHSVLCCRNEEVGDDFMKIKKRFK